MRSEAVEHTYRLSTLDHSILRAYIRYCLCFPCVDTSGPAIGDIFDKLQASCQRLVTHLPILAGRVRKISNDVDGQRGRVEVVVTLDNVQDFKADVSCSSEALRYNELSKKGMPPSVFVNEYLTPLPDVPNSDSNPAFAVQVNFVDGGALVALYLHHSVADVHGLGQIMRVMSSDLQPSSLTEHDLSADAAKHSNARDLLSDSKGAEASLENNSEYSLRAAEKALINQRFHYIYKERFVDISTLDCLTAILWKAVSRASWPNLDAWDGHAQMHRLTIRVSIRNRLRDPPLPEEYFGNTIVHAETRSSVLELSKPYEITSLAHTARLIRISIRQITNPVTRSKIATLHSLTDIGTAAISNKHFDTNLVVTSWDLPLSEAHLGLGLGCPEWGRKVGRGHSGYGCIVLPV